MQANIERGDRLTNDIALSSRIAYKVHHWIGADATRINSYTNGMDRAADITMIVREAMSEVRSQISDYRKLAYWKFDSFDASGSIVLSQNNIFLKEQPHYFNTTIPSSMEFFQVPSNSSQLSVQTLIDAAIEVKSIIFELINLRHIDTNPVIVQWELLDVVMTLESTNFPNLSEYNMLHWKVDYNQQNLIDHYQNQRRAKP